MAQNIIVVVSLSLLACVSATTREQCFNICQSDYRNGFIPMQTLNICRTSCQNLPLASQSANTNPGTSGTFRSSAPSRDDCLIKCDVDFRALVNGNMQANIRNLVYSQCKTKCNNLPGSATTTKAPTSAGNFIQCENMCNDDKTQYERQIIDKTFVQKIWLTCKAQCFKKYSQGQVKDECRQWLNRLVQMYKSDKQSDLFLEKLQFRGIQACNGN